MQIYFFFLKNLCHIHFYWIFFAKFVEFLKKKFEYKNYV